MYLETIIFITRQLRRVFLILLGVFVFLSPAAIAQQAVQDSLLHLINSHHQDDERKAELLNTLSFNMHFTNPTQGIIYAQQVIDFADNLKEKGYLYYAYMNKGANLMQLAEYDEALEYYDLALAGFRREGDKANTASVISNTGIAYKLLNNYPKALSNLQEAAHLFKEIEHPHEPIMYQNMAAIYSEQKNFDKALEYYEIAREGANRSKNKRLEAYVVFNIGTLLIDQNKLKEGLHYLDSALITSREINDNSLIARIYGNMGEAYNKLEDKTKSIVFLNKALSLNDSIGNKKSRALNLINLGDTYFSMGNLPLAGEYARQAYQEGKLLETIDVQQFAAQNLSTYFEKTGNADSALFYYKQHILLRDSIDNEQNKQQLTRLEMQYDFDLKEQEYLKDQEVSMLRIRQLWLYGLIAVTIVTVLAIYLLQRSRIRAIRLKNEIKEKELLQQAESILTQQKISESELKAIRSQMNPHFIFNVLNSIESYILDNDAKTASKLVQKFASLSRLILENSTQSMVVAEREWKAVELYVELEAIRFDHQFEYHFNVISPLQLSDILMPPMLIQPLVENAIHHGLRHVVNYTGKLSVSIEKIDGQLRVTVTDNGVGLKSTEKKGISKLKQQSMGIAGIKERIGIINDKDESPSASFELIDLHEMGERGTKALLVLPLILVRQEEIHTDN